MKPVIVGESNPYGPDEEFALYPAPHGCAGWRLCHLVMRLDPDVYVESFERVNLLHQARWSAPLARDAARQLVQHYPEIDRIWILLGSKVSSAFGLQYAAPTVVVGRPAEWEHRDVLCPRTIVTLPHPSGRSRAWTDRGMFERCRDVLRTHLPTVPFGEV